MVSVVERNRGCGSFSDPARSGPTTVDTPYCKHGCTRGLFRFLHSPVRIVNKKEKEKRLLSADEYWDGRLLSDRDAEKDRLGGKRYLRTGEGGEERPSERTVYQGRGPSTTGRGGTVWGVGADGISVRRITPVSRTSFVKDTGGRKFRHLTRGPEYASRTEVP